MANYYVDSNSGSNGDNGTTQALAWATIEYALESGGLSAGDEVWVRRTHAEYSGAPTSDIVPIYAGTRGSPIKIVGWPRAAIPNTTITSATWTNGSTTVDLVVGVTLDREKHLGRWATAPNGSKFLITKITDSNTLVIDREYSGATVTLTNGKFQIEADEDHADRPTDVDGWDSDADDLPVIDFGGTAYRIFASSIGFLSFRNLEMKDSTQAYGPFYLGANIECMGCLFYVSAASRTAGGSGYYSIFIRCIFTSGSTSGTFGVYQPYYAFFKDCAIYGFEYGIDILYGELYLDNVNIGVEAVNATYDLNFGSGATGSGKDVNLGSSEKVRLTGSNYLLSFLHMKKIGFENFGKVLGKHKAFTTGHIIESLPVVAGSGDPYKRSGGADNVIKVDCSVSSAYSPGVGNIKNEIFNHEFETGTASKSYRYYVQCEDLALTAEELWLECEYVDSYDDTSEYTISKVKSDEACTIRSGVSDWDQYIEVTGIAPAVASKVRIKCFIGKYDADGYIYIDPQVVAS